MCEMMSQVLGFGFPKLLLRKRHVLSIFYSEIYGLKEQKDVTNLTSMERPKSKQDLHHGAGQSVQR